jgi:hypothetical protein
MSRSSTLKMTVSRSTETFVTIYLTTLSHMKENSNPHQKPNLFYLYSVKDPPSNQSIRVPCGTSRYDVTVSVRHFKPVQAPSGPSPVAISRYDHLKLYAVHESLRSPNLHTVLPLTVTLS